MSFIVTGLILFGAVMSAVAQNNPARGPSTPEERAREVAIARQLEASPLNDKLLPDREWAVNWINAIPDLRVVICPGSLGKEVPKSKYKYAPLLWSQLLISSAAFMIEHPDQAGDQTAVYIAGAESMLKAYAAILSKKPKARWPELDPALDQQQNGQLAELIRETSKACH